jgi:hypothetical protein
VKEIKRLFGAMEHNNRIEVLRRMPKNLLEALADKKEASEVNILSQSIFPTMQQQDDIDSLIDSEKRDDEGRASFGKGASEDEEEQEVFF